MGNKFPNEFTEGMQWIDCSTSIAFSQYPKAFSFSFSLYSFSFFISIIGLWNIYKIEKSILQCTKINMVCIMINISSSSFKRLG